MEVLPKTDKITRILILYNNLINGKHINKSEFSWENGINERTFDRDIEDVRLFLSEIYSSREVLFDRETNSYFLSGDKPAFLDRTEALIIAKVLFESRVFRNDEMYGLYNSLLGIVTQKDAVVIGSYLKDDICRYESKTNTALLKIVGDLYNSIKSGMDIEIRICSDKDVHKVIKVSPLEISIEDSNIYLVAATNMDISSIDYYRLDDIDSFSVANTMFARELQKEYAQRRLKDK